MGRDADTGVNGVAFKPIALALPRVAGEPDWPAGHGIHPPPIDSVAFNIQAGKRRLQRLDLGFAAAQRGQRATAQPALAQFALDRRLQNRVRTQL